MYSCEEIICGFIIHTLQNKTFFIELSMFISISVLSCVSGMLDTLNKHLQNQMSTVVVVVKLSLCQIKHHVMKA